MLRFRCVTRSLSLTLSIAGASCSTLGGCSPAPPARPVAIQPPAPHPGPAADHKDHDHDHDHKDHKDHAHDHDHDMKPARPAAGGPALDADHDHDHPRNFAEGVAALKKLAGVVAQHVTAGVRDPLDEAVHEMGHLLEDVHGLVKGAGLAEAAATAARAGLDELFECFDAIDTALHAEDPKAETPAQAHVRVTPRIDQAIEALERIGKERGP